MLTFQGHRQIRNAFQTAIAIATYEAKEANGCQHGESNDKAVIPKLSVAHFKKVAKSARQFDRYLNSVNSGKSESDLARLSILRQDEFNTEDGDDDDDDVEERQPRKARKGSRRHGKNSPSASSGPSDDSSSTPSDSDSAPKKKRKRHSR